MSIKTRAGVLASVLLAAIATNATARDLARETIPALDGWGATSTTALPNGTTGGAAAASDRVFTVTNRNELAAALASSLGTAPRIIQIAGTIDANVDNDGDALSCEDYYRPDPETGEMYSLEKFLEAYDPATWGRVAPSGPQERARAASKSAQEARIRMRVPYNTTIVGLGSDARVVGAWFDIRRPSGGSTTGNIIIRNIAFEDVADCFPVWSPTDGAAGSWNAAYDAISVRDLSHIWIDHNSFRDRATRDDRLPHHFGVLYQVHDGHLDITNAAD
jgi:pectate lyase